MGAKHSRFSGYAQQDSHEFISQCLEELEQEAFPKKKHYQQIDYDDLKHLSE